MNKANFSTEGSVSSDFQNKIVKLKNGLEAYIRPIQASDKTYLSQGFHELGRETIRQRFHSSRKGFTDEELVFLTEIDGQNHFAIGAINKQSPQPDGMGVARYVRLSGEPQKAELALTIKDRYQNIGLGSVLLNEICQHALKKGILFFSGHVHTSNTRMIYLLKKRPNFKLVTKNNGLLELHGPLS